MGTTLTMCRRGGMSVTCAALPVGLVIATVPLTVAVLGSYTARVVTMSGQLLGVLTPA